MTQQAMRVAVDGARHVDRVVEGHTGQTRQEAANARAVQRLGAGSQPMGEPLGEMRRKKKHVRSHEWKTLGRNKMEEI